MALALESPNTMANPGAANDAGLGALIGGQGQPGPSGPQDGRKEAVLKEFRDLQTIAQRISRMEPGMAEPMRKILDLSMAAMSKFVGTLQEPEPGGSNPYM